MTHHDDSLKEKILARIERERLRPRPRWEFVLKNVVFWGLGALAVVFGALAVSAGVFEAANADWRFWEATHDTFWGFFLSAAPILWGVALLLFIAVGYYNIRHTKSGYRYPLSVLALGAVLTSTALGAALYASGVGRTVEEGVGSFPPFYRPILVEERAWWQDPARGALAGQVVSVSTSTSSFTLQDFAGALWRIDTDDLRAPDFAALLPGATVRVVGVPATTTAAFHACFVFPWGAVATFSLPLGGAERTSRQERSEECKGIRPYGALEVLRGD